MQRRRTLWVAAATSSLLTLSAVVHAALSSPSDARVAFQASGPAGLKIEGTTTELNVSQDGDDVTIRVPLANLSTGIALRDKHMKEKYLEVQKYPEAVLVVPRTALQLPQSGERFERDVQGTLKLHGQSRPTAVHYDAKGDGAGMRAQGKFRINMNDFGISVPSYLGVTVKPEVDVSAGFRIAGRP